MKSALCLLLLTTYALMAIAAPPSGEGRAQARESRGDTMLDTIQDYSGTAARRTIHLARPLIIQDMEGTRNKRSMPRMPTDRTAPMGEWLLPAMRPPTEQFNPASPTIILGDLPAADSKIRVKRTPTKKGGYGGGYGGGGGGCCNPCGGCGGGKGGGGGGASSSSSAQSSAQSSSSSYGQGK